MPSDQSRHFTLVIVGGGPGGTAPLLAAHRNGKLGALLDAGVAVFDASGTLGCGALGSYAITSDSTGTTFADCLTAKEHSPLTALLSHPVAEAVAGAGAQSVPLEDAGRFMAMVGQTLGEMIAAHPASTVFAGHRVLAATRQQNGLWRLEAEDASGRIMAVTAENLLIATGASQPASRLHAEIVAGENLAARFGHKLIQSGDAIGPGGWEAIADRIAGVKEPRIAIIGGSTSAVCIAVALLNRFPAATFGEGGITLLHRRPIRVFYPNTEAALAENYTEWGPDDICPLSKRVFRLAGLRLESRELIMQARGIGGRSPEPRLRLHQIAEGRDEAALALLEQADLIIACFGYRPRGLPLSGPDGGAIRLFFETGPAAPMVDRHCRVMDEDGAPVPGLFGMGLAAGFVPWGRLGGEPSFRGQANGLWLWQTDAGMMIVEAVLAGRVDLEGRPAAPPLDPVGAGGPKPRSLVPH